MNYIMLDGKKIPLSQETEQSLREAQEQDYEILEHEYAKFVWDTSVYVFSPKIHNIHSVRRLSDGEVFTVGDKVRHDVLGYNNKFLRYNNWKINSIRLVDNKVQLYSGTGFHKELNEIEKRPKPLFTTEDGVDIFEGDTDFWWVNEDVWKALPPDVIKPYPRNIVDYKHFSTKEKAQEYIDLHKPKYSKKDIEKYFNRAFAGCVNFEHSMNKFIKELDE